MGIIFNLPSLQMADAIAAFMGVFGIIVGALNLAAAYGLLKLQGWARRVAALAFVSAIAFARRTSGSTPRRAASAFTRS